MKYQIIFLLLFSFIVVHAQSKDKAVFKKPAPGFYQEMQKEINDFKKPANKERTSLRVDLEGRNFPKSIDEFTKHWHSEPISQGQTGTCWSFSSTSFFESEIKRIHNKEIKLSEMYTVYWEYVEKAKRYVNERGNSEFGEGSEANATPKIWRMYGAVPYSAYSGLKEGQKYPDHSDMFDEMSDYLKTVKQNKAWNQDEVVSTIKSILNHNIGTPPQNFNYEGNEYTPKAFFTNVMKLKLDDYIDVLSIMQQPYFEKVEYEVSDNWWNSKDYYNVPLDIFMDGIKNAVKKGYTICIGGDVSEPGYDAEYEVAVVPSFDIPSEYIDENARQFRFSNRTTTDDHGIHLVGYKVDGNKMWFLIKDSGAGSRTGNNKGYYFYDEDYVKLKIMDYMVHKDAIPEIMEKFKK
ncbi:MAG: peptidase C1 [Ignavibacteria bacterium]|nr:peptidase C1 [Ignavibacteria bacterium]